MRGDGYLEQFFPQAVVAAHHREGRRAGLHLKRPGEFSGHAAGEHFQLCIFDGLAEHLGNLLMHGLVAMYCGVPAAIETNRIAAEIFGEALDPADGPAAKP